MKTKKLLQDFTNYCNSHPKQRFWQALRNWSGYSSIYGAKDVPCEYCSPELEDTFYKEGK